MSEATQSCETATISLSRTQLQACEDALKGFVVRLTKDPAAGFYLAPAIEALAVVMDAQLEPAAA